jgi:enamine deaminase RidA (YjgF/YER057c/UK114 family)
MDIQRHGAGAHFGWYSQIVEHNGTIYLSGQIADDATQSMAGQTKQVLDKIENLLKSVGSSKSKILSVQIWLKEISMWNEYNAVWDSWIDPEHPPARATCQAIFIAPQHLIEMTVIAAK